jgi:hypothetical protein
MGMAKDRAPGKGRGRRGTNATLTATRYGVQARIADVVQKDEEKRAGREVRHGEVVSRVNQLVHQKPSLISTRASLARMCR